MSQQAPTPGRCVVASTNPNTNTNSNPNTNPNRSVCGGVNYTSDGMFPSVIAVYTQILRAHRPRIMVYNGDVDPGCNYLWAEASVQKFAETVTRPWRPWVYGKTQRVGEQLGGFVTDYSDNISFATIHGAGHMSPQWRPEAVFFMLRNFLSEKSLTD